MKAAVFLDRDGTLNEEVGYLHRPEEVMLIPGAAQAVARLNSLGVPVVVVTNQAGIGGGNTAGRTSAPSRFASRSCWRRRARTWTPSTPRPTMNEASGSSGTRTIRTGSPTPACC